MEVRGGCWKVELIDSWYPLGDLEQAAVHLGRRQVKARSGVSVPYLAEVALLLMRCCEGKWERAEPSSPLALLAAAIMCPILCL